MLLAAIAFLAGAVGGYFLRLFIDRNAKKVAALQAVTGVSVPTMPQAPKP